MVGICHRKEETAAGKVLAGDLNLGQHSNRRAQTTLLLGSFFQFGRRLYDLFKSSGYHDLSPL